MPEVLRTAVLRGGPLLLFAWGLLEMFLAWRLGAARGDPAREAAARGFAAGSKQAGGGVVLLYFAFSLGVLAGMVPEPRPGEFGAGAERLARAVPAILCVLGAAALLLGGRALARGAARLASARRTAGRGEG